MNVATKLMLEQMKKDIEELKQRIAVLESNRERKTLTLPSKQKNAQAN